MFPLVALGLTLSPTEFSFSILSLSCCDVSVNIV